MPPGRDDDSSSRATLRGARAEGEVHLHQTHRQGTSAFILAHMCLLYTRVSDPARVGVICTTRRVAASAVSSGSAAVSSHAEDTRASLASLADDGDAKSARACRTTDAGMVRVMAVWECECERAQVGESGRLQSCAWLVWSTCRDGRPRLGAVRGCAAKEAAASTQRRDGTRLHSHAEGHKRRNREREKE